MVVGCQFIFDRQGSGVEHMNSRPLWHHEQHVQITVSNNLITNGGRDLEFSLQAKEPLIDVVGEFIILMDKSCKRPGI